MAIAAISHAETLNGTQLYAKHCAKCHNDLKNTNRAGRRASRIYSAIKANIGGMGYLKSLNKDEVQAISDALTRLEAPPDSMSGRDLYRIYCSSCHKEIDKSTIKSKTSADVLAAMKRQSCTEVNLGFLKKEDRIKIAEALRPATAGTAPSTK